MKTMNVSRSLILLFTLLSYIPHFLSAPTPVTPPFHQEIEMNTGVPGQEQNYFSISLAGLSNHDLLISIVSQWGTAPKVFIAKQDTQPQSVTESGYSSTSSSGSAILIKSADLLGLQNLYMNLACNLRTCKASISIEWTQEILVTADKGAVTEMNAITGLSSAIVRLDVPQVVDANRVVIHVDALSTNKSRPADVNMLVGVAPVVPVSNQAQNIPRSAWYAGRTAVIYQGNNLFCTGCQYLLNLQFTENTELRVEAHVLSQEMRLTHKSYLDGVQMQRYNSYFHVVNEKAKEKDLVISLQAQEGSVKVYIDCGVPTDQYETFRWKYASGKANEQIVLTPEEHAKCQDRKYIIVVYGIEDSVYSIKAAARDSTNLRIRKDAPVVGTIMPQEEIDYELFVPVFLTEKVNITFKSPGNVEMYVLNCRFLSECPNSLTGKFEHVEIESAVEPEGFIYLAAKENDAISITLDMAKNGCYGLLVEKSGMLTDEDREGPVCAFKVIVRSQDSNPADYSLAASVEGHELLYPGIAEQGVVYAGDSVYYMMHVRQKHLLKLQFQLTVLSGHAKMFVSRKTEFPNATEEASVTHEGAVVYDNLELYNGTYYVAIQGTTTSTYLLTPTVISSTSQPIDYATMLKEGVAHKGVIVIRQQEYPEQFYKFKVNLQEDFKGKIKITVAPMRGNLVITVNNNENIPTTSRAQWLSKNNTLEISSDDEYFKRQNVYHVALYLNLEDPTSMNLKEITYTISYSVISTETDATGTDTLKNKNHMMLTTSFPHHGIIQAGHIMYFKALIHPSDTPITLFKRASSGDLDIYLSTDPNNQYPDANNYKLSTVTTRKNELTVQKSDLHPSCTNSSDSSICNVYFSISTSSSEQVPFTLSLYSHAEDYSQEIKPVQLEDGKERDIKLPTYDRPVYFYFYPTPKENVFIDVACPNKEITIYANYEKVLTETNSETNPTYPSDMGALYNSLANEDDLHSGTAHLAIPIDPESNVTFVVTIAVYFADSVRPGSNNTPSSTFSIVASSHTRHIYPGKTYRGKVEEESYLYYVMNVPKENCTLFITMTNIDDGDADLFVSFGDYERPTKEDHKFVSSSNQRTELLEINLLDIYPHTSMKGKWVIGVYGKKKGAFALTASYEGQKMIQLQQGIPIELYLKKSKVQYFQYLHDSNNSFDIRVDKQSGNLGVYITALDPRENITSVLPTSEKCTWNFTQDKQSFIKIETSDPEFCSDCLYIIGIEVLKSSKFSVLITEVGGITLLQSSLRYYDKLQPKEKKQYMLVLKNADELTLSASISAGQLDIYAHNTVLVNSTLALWNMNLTPADTYQVLTMKKDEFRNKLHSKSYWNGKRFVISQENVFYFDFENPGNVATEFSFSMQPPNMSIVLLPNEFHDFVFKAEEERSFLYYSSAQVSGSINVLLKYCITHNGSNETLSEKLTELAEGFGSEVNYWTQQSTVGVGSEIAVIKDEVNINNIRSIMENENATTLSIVCVDQTLEIEDQEQEGRYEFIFTNSYAQELDVSIRLDITALNFKSVDRNYHGVEHLEVDEKRIYQITYTGDGYTYLDFFACSGIVSIKMGDSIEAIKAGQVEDTLVTPFGRREVFTKSKVDSTSKKYFEITTHEVSKNLGDLTADVMISTSYFPQDTGEYKTSDGFDVHGRLHDPELTHTYDFKYEESSLTLNFKSFAIADATSQHTLLFYIRLCPKGTLNNLNNFCIAFMNPEGCYMAHQSSGASAVQTIQQKFNNVPPGDYELHIAASMSYGETSVRPFVYEMKHLSVGEPMLSKIWDILLFFIVVGLIIACLSYGFRKLKNTQMERGYDMKVFKKTRDYGFVGDEDEDDDDDERIEVDKEKENMA